LSQLLSQVHLHPEAAVLVVVQRSVVLQCLLQQKVLFADLQFWLVLQLR
jgi:hypothetical protein